MEQGPAFLITSGRNPLAAVATGACPVELSVSDLGSVEDGRSTSRECFPLCCLSSARSGIDMLLPALLLFGAACASEGTLAEHVDVLQGNLEVVDTCRCIHQDKHDILS